MAKRCQHDVLTSVNVHLVARITADCPCFEAFVSMFGTREEKDEEAGEKFCEFVESTINKKLNELGIDFSIDDIEVLESEAVEHCRDDEGD